VPISNAAAAGSRRFHPGLLPTLAAATIVVLTILLGNWQARRADVRGSLQQQAESMASAPALEMRRAADVAVNDRYRHARATGEYDAPHQVWLDNRTHNGAPGFQVLTPLRLDDGSHLLVARGWIARSTQPGGVTQPMPASAPGAAIAPPAPPPSGRVAVEGRLNQPPPRFLELKHVEPQGNVWQNLDLAEYARATGRAVAPLILEQAAQGLPDGLIRDWPAPDLGRDKNVSYMWQWYAFAGVTVAFWLILGWRRSDG
jgi:cytochrome oxidase assembly protein ShyY1